MTALLFLVLTVGFTAGWFTGAADSARSAREMVNGNLRAIANRRRTDLEEKLS